MTLTSLPDVTNEADASQPDATVAEQFRAGWTAETVRTDSWWYTNRVRSSLMREIYNNLPFEAQERVFSQQSGDTLTSERILLDEAGKARADGDPVWAETPATLEELDQEVDRRRLEALQDAEDVLGDSFSLPGFIGQMGRAATDPVSIALLPFGAGGSLLRIGAKEAALGAVGEAAILPREMEVADDLDLERPNPVERIAMGAGVGGALGVAIAGVPRVYRYAAAKRSAGDGSRPSGVNPLDHQDDITARRDHLEFGEDASTPLPAPNRIDMGEDVATAGPSMRDFVGGDPVLQNPIIRQTLDFIGDLEAPKGYNQVYSGIAPADHPPQPLTEMTIDQVLAWQDSIDPRYQSEAAGRYQIMEDTLRHLKRSLNLSGSEVFSREMQDRLAIALMREKGMDQFLAGSLSPARFGNNLASIWAGLPQLTGAGRGSSVYAGLAGNKSLISASRFERVLSRPGSYRATEDLFDDGTSFTSYGTSRGYTGTGQVAVGDGMRIDVEYEVVDASLLRQAGDDLQPRDRSRVASDAWVNDTAARLDPAQLMPAPTADRGTPVVGRDNIIESGNGRVRAIQRTYEKFPDRADAYRRQIEATTGQPIPEGIERPVLIARRTSDLTREARRQMVVDAQDSGVARMTATERAQIGQQALSAEVLGKYKPGSKLSSAANRDFARAFAGHFPRSERNAFVGADGRISTDGIRQIQDSLFARAWADPEIMARALEAEPGEMKTLMDALADAAPEVAALRADIDAGLVRPEMDITPFVLDAVRLIMTARDLAEKGGQAADILNELLAEVDLLDGAVAPLTQALVRALMPNGKQAPARKIAEFLKRYATEARKAGRTGDALDPIGPLDVLKRMDADTFGDLSETGAARVAEPPAAPAGVFPETAFADGATSPEAQAADDLLEESFFAEAAQAEAEVRQADAAGEIAPEIAAFEFIDDATGLTLTGREIIDDLNADDVLDTVIDTCTAGRAA